MKSKTELSVVERVEVAVLHLQSRNSSGSVTVAEVCRVAGVSRSSLYEHHLDLIGRIRSSRPRNASLRHYQPKDTDSRVELERLKIRNKALLYICTELQIALSSAGLTQAIPVLKERA